MMNRLPANLEGLREEFRRSRTLRYGTLAVAGILWLYGILVLHDAVTAKRQAWLATEARIARAKALAVSGDWAARSTEAKTLLADYETLLWKDGSVGLSQAAAQESLTRSLSAAGLSVRQVRATAADSPVSNDLPDILPIRVQAIFDFRAPAFYNWLAALAKDRADKKPSFTVESLSIRGAQTPTVDAVLMVYTAKPGADK